MAKNRPSRLTSVKIHLSGASLILLITLIISALGISNMVLSYVAMFACLLLIWFGVTFDNQKGSLTPEVKNVKCNTCDNDLVTTELYCRQCQISTTLHKVKSE